MGVLEKAVWYIEWQREAEIGLDDVAAASGVSRFHLARLFQGATGQPVMAYLRGRRLTEAARRLAFSRDDILTVALDAGYGSHEAFTRAFRAQFGLTQDRMRKAVALETLQLVEPHVTDTSLIVDLAPPRMDRRDRFHVAGLSERFTFANNRAIPTL